MSFLPALISASSSILGGLFGQSEADKDRQAQARANAQNIAFQRQANAQNIREARRASNVDWQRYNQARSTNLQTIAADARAAGIHPLAALGVNMAGVPASPVGSVRAPRVDPAISPSGSAIGDGIARAGAQLGDGVAQLFDQRARLENELLSAQIQQTRAGTATMLANATSRSAISSVQNKRHALQFGGWRGELPEGTIPAGDQPETELGEIGQLIQSLYNLSRTEFTHSDGRKTSWAIARRARREREAQRAAARRKTMKQWIPKGSGY